MHNYATFLCIRFFISYVPPPPSRPRYNNPQPTANYNQQNQPNVVGATHQPPSAAAATNSHQPSAIAKNALPSPASPKYGMIISHPNHLHQPQDVNKSVVNSLAVKYVPNYGNQYVAIVPKYAPINTAAAYQQQNLNDNNDVYYDKPNGKYNSKLKKYKAYEQKVKLMPYYFTVSRFYICAAAARTHPKSL